MRFILILLLSLGIELTSNPLCAQTTSVGISAQRCNFFAAAQGQTQWCWAASLQMVFNYYGVNINQMEIVNRTYGGLINAPGSPEAITANLNNMNIDDNGRQYSVSAAVGYGAPNAQYLINALSSGQPVLIGYNTGSSGHAVVITACEYIPTPYGPQIVAIAVRDPWPSPENIANQGRVVYRGIDLAQRITMHWFIMIK